MKTVAEIARDIGVSKTAIQKKIKQEPLKSQIEMFSKTIDNALRIDNDGEQLIKSAFSKMVGNSQTEVGTSQLEISEPQTEISTSQTKVGEPQTYIDELITNLKNENEYLRQQNKQFQDQLTTEREHSRNIAEKLVELTRNSQVLLKQEQDKSTLLLPEQTTKRPFWQFWKK